MCGHEIVSVKEQEEVIALVIANNWDLERQMKELDKIMQANGDKFHK